MTTEMSAPNKKRDITGIQGVWGIWERMVPNLVDRLDAPSQWMLEIHLRRYRIAGQSVRGNRVLDVASGTGYGSRMLKDAGASSVIGIELSPEAVEYAKSHYQCDGIEFLIGNAEEFSFEEPFDVVISFETIEHLPNPKKFLAQLHHHLKPNGLLLLSVPIGETRHIDGYHLHVFERSQVYRLLANAGFQVKAFRFDDWKITGKELIQLGKIYPEANIGFWELLCTRRGRHLLSDLIKKGCIGLPMLMVAADRMVDVPCGVVDESLLSSLEENTLTV